MRIPSQGSQRIRGNQQQRSTFQRTCAGCCCGFIQNIKSPNFNIILKKTGDKKNEVIPSEDAYKLTLLNFDVRIQRFGKKVPHESILFTKIFH